MFVLDAANSITFFILWWPIFLAPSNCHSLFVCFGLDFLLPWDKKYLTDKAPNGKFWKILCFILFSWKVELFIYWQCELGQPPIHLSLFQNPCWVGILSFFLVIKLRLSQRKDDTAEGWLKPFLCHNTLTATTIWLPTT